MTTLDHIRELLHLIAGILVWPVMVGLLGLAALSVIILGAYAREVRDRRRNRKTALSLALQRLDRAASDDSNEALDLRLERVLQEEELRLWRPVTQLRLAVRTGPALGLMGTLIPMAYALQ